MKYRLILWAALLCGFLFRANAQGVEFRDLTFRQALEQAQKEGKLVFMDCYTSWCGPCKNMLNNVFTLSEAGEFMNAAFVCVKFDMEKGEGKELRKQFQVRAYPTFFIIRPDGTVQHRLAGGSPWERFRERVERGLNEKTSYHYLDACYQKGKLSPKQYPQYVQALKDASDGKQVEGICLEVFGKLNNKARCRKENWFLFDQEMKPTDIRFEYLVDHKDDFDRNVGKGIVDGKISSVYSEELTRLNSSKENEWPARIGEIAVQLGKIDFEGKQKIENLVNYEVAYLSKDVEGVLKSLEEYGSDLPQYVVMDLVFQYGFILREGTNEQIARYIRLGRQNESRALSPQMVQLMREYMDRYESELNDRLTYAGIRGKVTRGRMDEVYLYKVEDGKECLIATSKVSRDGWYGFTFQPERKGFYTVGGKESLDRIRLYMQPGDRGEVNFPEDTIVITARNTPENLLLASWESLMIPVRERTDNLKYALFDYRDFFPYFMDFLPRAREFQEKITFRDEEFRRLVRQTIDFDLDYYAFRILNALKAGKETHKPSRPTPADYPVYYKTIVAKNKLSDASILEQPYGYDYLQRYTTFACGGDKASIPLEERLTWLSCNLLKAEIVLWRMENCRKYEDYMKMLNTYGDYFTTSNHQKRLDAVSAKLYKGITGEKASDFTYPDNKGKMVSLSDFRGKVVVVDVWATWCGPCRAEIPYLVKLEKEMEGKDVVFIGVSVDEQKDHKKWLEVLEKEGLEGVQLFTNGRDKNGRDKIIKDYKIKGIPRFMVFDKKGNVVTINSPRPSNLELRKLLERELRK